jgi:hypothetical protein
MPDAMQREMLESGWAFGRELVATVLASAPDIMQAEDAAAHAAVIAHTIDDTAARMRDGGLGERLAAIWFEAAVSAARHGLEARSGPSRNHTAE